jgi:hypothetical protein
MNFFLCKKCDKFSEEKPVNINNCTENYNTNDVIYYTNVFYDAYVNSKNINDFNSIDNTNIVINNPKVKLQDQEDELEIIEYPYEYSHESINNCSKSTLKKYSLNDDDINMMTINTNESRQTSIKCLFFNKTRKKNLYERKNKLLNRESFKNEIKDNNINKNYKTYFLQNKKQKKYLTVNPGIRISNTIKKPYNTQPIFKNVKHNGKLIIEKKNKNNLKDYKGVNNSLKILKTNHSFQYGIPKIKNKDSFNSFKSKILPKKNEDKKNSNIIGKNKSIFGFNNKQRDYTMVINEAIKKKMKMMDSAIKEKSNLNKYIIFSSCFKRQINKRIKRMKKDKTKKSKETNESNIFSKSNKTIS